MNNDHFKISKKGNSHETLQMTNKLPIMLRMKRYSKANNRNKYNISCHSPSVRDYEKIGDSRGIAVILQFDLVLLKPLKTKTN